MSNVPIFLNIFGIPWESLPPVMQKHYAVRPNSRDRVVVNGVMNIRRNWLMRLASPLLCLAGALVPFDGQNIPTTVTFYSGPDSEFFHFDRVFRFPDKEPFRFHSRLKHVRGNEVIEFMRCGIGWHSSFKPDGNKVILGHIGYVWKIGKFVLPLPITWLIGNGAAEEEVLTDDSFRMWMTVTHPLLGECYRYEGTFTVTEVTYA